MRFFDSKRGSKILKKILPRSSTPARCGTSCAPQEQDFQISRFENLAEPKTSFELASFQDLELFLLQISRFRNLEVVRAMALALINRRTSKMTVKRDESFKAFAGSTDMDNKFSFDQS